MSKSKLESSSNFTQLVWKSTEKIASGLEIRTSENNNDEDTTVEYYLILVSIFTPPGNTPFKYGENVKNTNDGEDSDDK